MPVLKNISRLYTCRDEGLQKEVFPVENATLAWIDDTIVWSGKERDLPAEYLNESSMDAEGGVVVPGFIDCHTHLAFGGWRADEFEMRVKGKSYLEIAKEGGGILSTVKATRQATEVELFVKCLRFLEKIKQSGVTSIECKSGYGLTVNDELKTLRVYQRLKEVSECNIKTTFLGAHSFPPEYRGKHRAYIDLIINEMLPKVAKENLADFCDVFVEESAFSLSEAREILEAGKTFGLIPKLHANQLSTGGGAELAAEVGAISADHLEHVSDTGIRKMAEAGVVAVNLPLASLYTQQPFLNCRPLIDAGIPVAIATDFNPGSAPSYDIHLAMLLSCMHGRLTPDECLKAVTINAAKAIGIDKDHGSLESGKKADFLVLHIPDFNFWIYHYNGSKITAIVLKGKRIHP